MHGMKIWVVLDDDGQFMGAYSTFAGACAGAEECRGPDADSWVELRSGEPGWFRSGGWDIREVEVA